MIILKNVCFSYEDKEIIKDCSISLGLDEFHLLVGPTGAGKSTFAMILKGLLQPNKGRIFLAKGDLSSLRRKMGLMFQFPEDFFFNDTVLEEMIYGIRKEERESLKEKIKETLELLGLTEDILNHSPFELSYGEQRMLCLASLLIWEPTYLILDDPFVGLDWKNKDKVVTVLKTLKRKLGITIISQDFDSVISFVDRVSLLMDGKIIFSFPPQEVDWELVKKAGCDLPSSVILAEKLKENGIKLRSDIIPYTTEKLIEALKF
ncbi:MAG: energy-coupling factor ABC transporter ATP-binding protein [candidate division WOR-3 bacterium]